MDSPLRYYSSERILHVTFAVNLMGALLLTLTATTGICGFPAQLVLLLSASVLLDCYIPNITAPALAPFATSAGSASAHLGTIQYTMGATAGVFVGLFHNGTGLPMVITMTCCAFVGSIVVRNPAEVFQD